MQIPAKLSVKNAELRPVDDICEQSFQDHLHSCFCDLRGVFSNKERPSSLTTVQVYVNLSFARLRHQWFHDLSFDSAYNLRVFFSKPERARSKCFRNSAMYDAFGSAVVIGTTSVRMPNLKPSVINCCSELARIISLFL